MQPAHPLDALHALAREGRLASVVATASATAGPDVDAPHAPSTAVAARALLRLGRTDEAMRWVEHARHVELAPADDAALLSVMAEGYRLVGKAASARNLSEQALAMMADPQHPARAQVLIDAARANLDDGQPQTAAALAAEARDTAATRDLRVAALLLIAELAVADARLDDARTTYTSILRGARKIGHASAEADATTGLARTLVELRDYPAGDKLHNLALPMHMKHGHRAGVAASLGGLGLCAMGQHVPAQGVQHLVRAVSLCHEIGHLPAESAWRAQLDAGLVLLERTEWRIRELEAWLEGADRLGDTGLTAWLYTELGHCHRDIKDPQAALPCYDAALAAMPADEAPADHAARSAYRALALAEARDTRAHEALTEARDTRAHEALTEARANPQLHPALAAELDEALQAL